MGQCHHSSRQPQPQASKCILSKTGRIRIDCGPIAIELKEYVAEHGNAYVPQTYSQNESLGIWVGNQRQIFKALQLGYDLSEAILTKKRVQKLDEIGLMWDALEVGGSTEASFFSITSHKKTKLQSSTSLAAFTPGKVSRFYLLPPHNGAPPSPPFARKIPRHAWESIKRPT